MRNLSFLLVVSIASMASCRQAAKQETNSEAKENFFPVKAYITSQLNLIDSLQLPVAKYVTANGHSDTTGLSIAECKLLAAPFLDIDISDPKLEGKYLEKSFADQSIPSVSFTYETRDSIIPLKRVDVVLKPDPVLTDKVKTIYMEKFHTSGDTLVNEKLFWKADHYYQIITSRELANAAPQVTLMKVVWDPTE